MSFYRNDDAKAFQLSVKNYNELNLLEFKNEFRDELQKILQPYVEQRADDRSHFLNFQKAQEHQ